jgi:hypothetical protein
VWARLKCSKPETAPPVAQTPRTGYPASSEDGIGPQVVDYGLQDGCSGEQPLTSMASELPGAWARRAEAQDRVTIVDDRMEVR